MNRLVAMALRTAASETPRGLCLYLDHDRRNLRSGRGPADLGAELWQSRTCGRVDSGARRGTANRNCPAGRLAPSQSGSGADPSPDRGGVRGPGDIERQQPAGRDRKAGALVGQGRRAGAVISDQLPIDMCAALEAEANAGQHRSQHQSCG